MFLPLYFTPAACNRFQDDNEEDGDEHDNGRSNRRRGRATMDDGSEFDEADQGDEDDDEGDNDDDRYDDAKIRNPRGGRPFPGAPKGRSMIKGGGRDKGDRYGTAEPVKSSGRMSITYTRRDGGGGGKPRGRVGDQDKMRERDRGRDRGDPSKAGNGRERDGMKGDGFVPMSRGKEKDSEGGGSRAKRRDLGNPHALPGDPEDKLASGGGYRERGDRTRDKIGPAPAGKKVWRGNYNLPHNDSSLLIFFSVDSFGFCSTNCVRLLFPPPSMLCDQDEAVIKTSWVTQMQKAKERPNLVHWRDELVAITKDSSEDFEDATLSVELMRVRCDVCYHEKSVSIGSAVIPEEGMSCLHCVPYQEISNLENSFTSMSKKTICWRSIIHRSTRVFATSRFWNTVSYVPGR